MRRLTQGYSNSISLTPPAPACSWAAWKVGTDTYSGQTRGLLRGSSFRLRTKIAAALITPWLEESCCAENRCVFNDVADRGPASALQDKAKDIPIRPSNLFCIEGGTLSANISCMGYVCQGRMSKILDTSG